MVAWRAAALPASAGSGSSTRTQSAAMLTPVVVRVPMQFQMSQLVGMVSGAVNSSGLVGLRCVARKSETHILFASADGLQTPLPRCMCC